MAAWQIGLGYGFRVHDPCRRLVVLLVNFGTDCSILTGGNSKTLAWLPPARANPTQLLPSRIRRPCPRGSETISRYWRIWADQGFNMARNRAAGTNHGNVALMQQRGQGRAPVTAKEIHATVRF